ncbi:MAG: phosphonoacetaldehyde reductase [Bacteroidales bacterium]|nr:phosphonoacetaldehyde reductase [Bacteroidales bacterium]
MNQQIVNGIERLSGILQEVGCRKLFLVVDSSYPFLNIKDAIEALPAEEKVKFSDFTPNPLYEQVCKGVELLKTSKCDTILAVGGGSAIDVAKCIKLAVLAQEGNAAIIPPLVSQRLPIDGTKIPFIAIPTTAGTGSESTHNAVMYYEGSKQTVTNDGILPDYALLAPEVLKTLPLYQKKCTMMDALCQGIESWWSVNSTEESYEYSRKAIELVMANWRKYIFENDEEAAAKIMLAANYSGRAINITATTAAHAMSYKITSLYKLPHGHAVAICLPEIWEYMLSVLPQSGQNEEMSKINEPRGFEYLSSVFSEIAQAMCKSSPIQAINTFRRMLKDLDILGPTAEPDLRSSELTLLTTSVNPVRLRNNPIKLDEVTIRQLYESIIN